MQLPRVPPTQFRKEPVQHAPLAPRISHNTLFDAFPPSLFAGMGAGVAELMGQLTTVTSRLKAEGNTGALVAQKAALEAELKAARRKRLMLGPNPRIGWGRT